MVKRMPSGLRCRFLFGFIITHHQSQGGRLASRVGSVFLAGKCPEFEH